MARGQLLKRERGFLVRVFVGRDPVSGKRRYLNQRVTGTRKDAERVLTVMLRKLDTGEFLVEPTRMTVREYLEHWLEAAAEPRLDPRTYQEYGGMMRRYVYQPLGSVALAKLAPIHIQEVYGAMLARGLSPRMVRYTHAVLSNALTQAVKWRLLVVNPAKYVDLPKQRKRAVRALSEAEVARFLAAAATDRHYVLFAVLLGTGLRPGEALALHWEDFDPGLGSLTVQRSWGKVKVGYAFKEPKTRRGRRNVKLPDSLGHLLVDHRSMTAGSALIFPSAEGTPLNLRNVVNRYYKPLLARAGIPPGVRLYDLRHTHATLLLKAGVHPKIVSERLGHASIALTLDTYSHVLPGMQDEAARKLEAMLFASPEAPRRPRFN